MQVGKNKTILLIAYYFPPIGMGGTGRPYALFRYLPDYGYNVIVLTVKDILYPQYDYSLLNEDDRKRIDRCGSFDPARMLYLIGKRKQKQAGYPKMSKTLPLYFPDLKRGWVFLAKKKLKKLISSDNITAVVTTAPPPSVHLLGLTLKKISQIPWVADFRDYWFSLPIERIYPDGLMKKYSLRLKEKIQKQADEIISVNNDIRKYFGRGEVIMNGADRSVLEEWRKPYKDDRERIIIGLLGTFNYLVPIEPLLIAVRKIIDDNKIPERKLLIIHAGHTDAGFDRLIDKYRLGRVVTKKGYLERARAIGALLPCDILYIGVSRFDEYNILPGRIFDYLVSGRPVLGVVPEKSDMASLLDEYRYGTSITDHKTDKIVDYLITAYEKKMNNLRPARSFDYNAEKYTMPALAEKYAAVLDRLTE